MSLCCINVSIYPIVYFQDSLRLHNLNIKRQQSLRSLILMAKKMCGQAGGGKAEAETESSYVSMNLASSPAVGSSGSADTVALSDDYILMK